MLHPQSILPVWKNPRPAPKTLQHLHICTDCKVYCSFIRHHKSFTRLPFDYFIADNQYNRLIQPWDSIAGWFLPRFKLWVHTFCKWPDLYHSVTGVNEPHIHIECTSSIYGRLCTLGASLAKYPRHNPMLPKAILQPLGRLAMQILLPALLITTLGKQLSIEVLFGIYQWRCCNFHVIFSYLHYALTCWQVLKDSYPIFFWSIAMQLVGVLISQALQLIVHVPKETQRVRTQVGF